MNTDEKETRLTEIVFVTANFVVLQNDSEAFKQAMERGLQPAL